MSLKPKLNDDHLLNRLYHCISKIDKNTITGTAEMRYKARYKDELPHSIVVTPEAKNYPLNTLID
jgi:hypothetical protein